MSFWKNVDSELEFQSKTRKELANEIGFDVTCISSGIRRDNIPAADTALKIAKALNVSLESLLDMEDEKKTETSEATDEVFTYQWSIKDLKLYKKYSPLIEKFEKLNSKSLGVIINLLDILKEN